MKAVNLILNSTLVSAAKTAALPTDKPLAEGTVTLRLEERAVPHNDFFTAQFLVSFPVAGAHQITIETQFVDEEERLWKSGQRPTQMNIKAFDDPRSAGRMNR